MNTVPSSTLNKIKDLLKSSQQMRNRKTKKLLNVTLATRLFTLTHVFSFNINSDEEK